MKDEGAREVRVDRGQRGGWEISLPDGQACIVCDTLDDARSQAHLVARRRQPCEMVIRDAYHRVIVYETIV